MAEPISELDGPVIDTSCGYICISCKDKVRHKKLPKFALARGLWLGEIPDELQQLSFAENLLIGKVRHNRCVVRVAKGMHKMIANAVTFEHPMQKIYTVLPPPIEEMDEEECVTPTRYYLISVLTSPKTQNSSGMSKICYSRFAGVKV